MNLCSVRGCGKRAKARGWCSKHYGRWQRNGHPQAGRREVFMSLEEIWDYIKKNSKKTKNGCREWQLCKGTSGYGSIRHQGKQWGVHRVVLARHTGVDIDNPLYALHHCDNPACVRPKHLYWGDKKQNADDRENRNRGHLRHGEHHAQALLTEKDVIRIRRNYRGRYGEKANLARKYNVHFCTIRDVLAGRSWKHI